MGIYIFVKIQWTGTSLVVQLLRLCVSTAGATGSILVGTKIPTCHGVGEKETQGKKKERNPVEFLNE